MKTFGKIVICIIVVLLAIGIAYLVYNGKDSDTAANINTTTNNKVDEKNTIANEINSNTETEYIGEEENKEEPEEDKEQETPKPEENVEELTGKDKAIDIVKKQYAVDGQTVRFDHMEGNDYIIKINDGTAVTWYLVNGTTWEAKEY